MTTPREEDARGSPKGAAVHTPCAFAPAPCRPAHRACSGPTTETAQHRDLSCAPGCRMAGSTGVTLRLGRGGVNGESDLVGEQPCPPPVSGSGSPTRPSPSPAEPLISRSRCQHFPDVDPGGIPRPDARSGGSMAQLEGRCVEAPSGFEPEMEVLQSDRGCENRPEFARFRPVFLLSVGWRWADDDRDLIDVDHTCDHSLGPRWPASERRPPPVRTPLQTPIIGRTPYTSRATAMVALIDDRRGGVLVAAPPRDSHESRQPRPDQE
jgi:hypothetical protein